MHGKTRARMRPPMARRGTQCATRWLGTAAAAVLLVSFFILGDPVPMPASASAVPMVFPLESRVPVSHTFFAARSGHLHQGIDLMAPKMTKEVAVVSGTVTLQVRAYGGLPWYTLWLAGDDGRGYYYSHINNDTPGTDDGQGGLECAFAPGLVTGSRVSQGQFLAYCGDSGNAESTAPHLHFEIHETTSMSSPAIDPYDSLYSAPLADDTPPPAWPDAELTFLEQTDSRVTYTGTWTTLAAGEASGGDYIYTDSKGEALVWFEGTGLDVIATKDTTQGLASVSLDGGPAEYVDLHSPTILGGQVVWSSGTLAQGTHTVSVAWTGDRSVSDGGTGINIDALAITGKLLQAPALTTFQETNSLLSYAGGWTASSDTSASGGSLRDVNAPGASVVAQFAGVYAAWVANTGQGYGMAKVTLDDNDPVTVDLYSASTLYRQQVWTSGMIGYGVHVIKIEWSGLGNQAATGTTINLDALQSIGALEAVGTAIWEGPTAGMTIEPPTPGDPPPSATRYEQTDGHIVMTGTWTRCVAGKASGADYGRSSTSSASATIYFTGTRLDWIAMQDSTAGMADIYLDGVKATTINLAASLDAYRVNVWSTGTLSNQLHSVKIARSALSASGQFITLDAVDIWGTIQAAPLAITSLSPSSGSIAGGTSVTIDGTGLSGASAVTFGGVNATSYTVNSPTKITAVAPAHDAGTVQVQITAAGGTTSDNAADDYTFVDAPTITGLSAHDGTTAGGTSVIITGTDLTGATSVTFGGTAATGVTVNSATQITCTSPAHTAGEVDVEVTTAGGSSSTSGTGDDFTYVAPPAYTRYDQTNINIVKTGTWPDYATTSAYNGSYGRSSTSGASAIIYFTGTRLDYIAMKGTTPGYADIWVDGVKVTGTSPINLYSATPAYQQSVWSTGTLSNGSHNVKIVRSTASTTGKYLTFDAVDIYGTISQPPVVKTRYEQTTTPIVKTGTWSNYSTTKASAGSYGRSSASAASATIKFVGTRLDYIAMKGTTTGYAEIWVDGVKVTGTTPINLYSSPAAYQQNVYSTGTLAFGAHTVKIVRGTASATGKYLTLDAFDVWGWITS